MARRTSNERKFVWARSRGTYTPGEASGPAADLLADFKARAAPGVLIGSTVMTVRGFIKPYVASGGGSWNTFGIRVCNESDVEGDGQADNTPDAQPEADWMAWLPNVVDLSLSTAYNPQATWNVYASPWAVDVRSNRRMEELGETLGLFFSTGLEGSTGVANVDWALSVGLKLP